jgi:hypothetical protein
MEWFSNRGFAGLNEGEVIQLPPDHPQWPGYFLTVAEADPTHVRGYVIDGGKAVPAEAEQGTVLFIGPAAWVTEAE